MKTTLVTAVTTATLASQAASKSAHRAFLEVRQATDAVGTDASHAGDSGAPAGKMEVLSLLGSTGAVNYSMPETRSQLASPDLNAIKIALAAAAEKPTEKATATVAKAVRELVALASDDATVGLVAASATAAASQASDLLLKLSAREDASISARQKDISDIKKQLLEQQTSLDAITSMLTRLLEAPTANPRIFQPHVGESGGWPLPLQAEAGDGGWRALVFS